MWTQFSPFRECPYVNVLSIASKRRLATLDCAHDWTFVTVKGFVM